MILHIDYSQTSRNQIRSLHPSIKPIVKARINEIRKNPYLGKALERELSGYYSYKAKRFRIVYKIDTQSQIVHIHHIGHRKDIYELLKELVKKEIP